MKKNMMFLSPDEGGGDGDEGKSKGQMALGGVEVADGPQAGDAEVRAQEELERGGGGDEKGDDKTGGDKKVKVEESKVTSTVVDAAELAKQFGGVIAELYKKEEDQLPPKKKFDELSQEEREKLIDLWEPDKAWQTKYDNIDTREEALKEMRNGMTRSAATISKLRVDELREELGTTIAETRAFMRDLQNEAAEKRLVKAYPDLGKPELQPIVQGVTKQIVESGKKFKVESELFDELAGGVEAVMKAAGVKDFKLSTGSNPANNKPKAKANPNAIPVTTPGAGGNTGGRTQEPETSRGIAVFAK